MPTSTPYNPQSHPITLQTSVTVSRTLKSERSRSAPPHVTPSTLPDAGSACNTPPEKRRALVPTSPSKLCDGARIGECLSVLSLAVVDLLRQGPMKELSGNEMQNLRNQYQLLDVWMPTSTPLNILTLRAVTLLSSPSCHTVEDAGCWFRV